MSDDLTTETETALPLADALLTIRLSGDGMDLVTAGQKVAHALAGFVTFQAPATGWSEDHASWCLYVVASNIDAVCAYCPVMMDGATVTIDGVDAVTESADTPSFEDIQVPAVDSAIDLASVAGDSTDSEPE